LTHVLQDYNKYGHAFVAGQLIAHLYSNLQPKVQQHIDKRRKELMYPRQQRKANPVIGMHIRGGDACSAHRFCPANRSIYWEKAAILREKYGAKRIFLATDDRQAAELCKSSFMGFECRMADIERAKFESDTFIEHRTTEGPGALSASTLALDVLTDIQMLASCDMYVFALRSAVARLAFALHLGTRRKVPPMLSLQWPYSSTWHKKKFMEAKLAMQGKLRASDAGFHARGFRKRTKRKRWASNHSSSAARGESG
jgi:hypothetical protein